MCLCDSLACVQVLLRGVRAELSKGGLAQLAFLATWLASEVISVREEEVHVSSDGMQQSFFLTLEISSGREVTDDARPILVGSSVVR